MVHVCLATDPDKRTKRRHKEDFQTSKDGRLIIEDDEEEEKPEPGSKRKSQQSKEPLSRDISIFSPKWLLTYIVDMSSISDVCFSLARP